MLSNVLIRLLLAFGLAGMFFSVWLSWVSDSYSVRIKKEDSVALIKRLDADDFPLYATEPIKHFLRRAILNPNLDNRAALNLIATYLSLRPFDAYVWLYGSRFHQRVGDIEQASGYLSVAHALSESNTPVLLRIFNRYLELGLIDEAMSVAQDIAAVKPREFRRLFYLMSRLSNDYERVVSEVIPKEARLTKKISEQEVEPDFYYKHALLDSIRLKNKLLAHEVWKSIPVKLKRGSELSLRYLDYQLQFQSEEQVKSVWFDILGTEVRYGEVYGSNGVSPCWNIRKVDGAETSVSFVDGALSFLKIKFLGEYNIGYNHISCITFLESGADYNLTWRSEGEGITTLSGIFFDVFFPGIDGKYYRSEGLIGSWQDANRSLKFKVPEEASFAKIRIRRQRTELLDSKIFGTVKLSNFRLQKIVNSSDIGVK